MQEIAATAAAHGYPLDDDIDVRLEQQTKGSHKPSLLQDLEAGKRVEIAAQLVAPLELAREAGVPVPTVEILAALLAARARAAGLYDG
jgi:2-dehydropantoate 2-reductase